MPIIDNPDLYKKAKNIADKKYDKPSAYKSGFIVKTYKDMGGTYSDDNKPKNLERWYKEEWSDIGGRDYPVYRPTKRITKDTPLTVSEIDPVQAKKQIELKQIIKGDANLPKFKVGGTLDFEEIYQAQLRILDYQQELAEVLQAIQDQDISDDENDALERKKKRIKKKIRDEKQYLQNLLKGEETVGAGYDSDYLSFLNGEPELDDKYVEEKVGGDLKPLICRQGNKFLLRDKIIPKIPPHKRYVELFAGSGSIFFNKEKADENILNDLDKNTSINFQLIKKVSIDPSKYTMDISTIDKTKQFYSKHINTKNSDPIQLVLNKVVACTGFSGKPVPSEKGIYKTFGLAKFLNSLPRYKDKLKGVKVLNQDYEKVIDKYNTVDTFFFIDPPYENTNVSFKYAEDKGFDFQRLANSLRKIKGNFFMTINDSKNIRDLFKGFNIKPIDVFNSWSSSPLSKIGKVRKELFITNYKI